MSQADNVAAKSHPIKEWGKSLTRQSELKYADINLIMAKYEKSGVLPPATRDGFFADVSTVGDYRDAIERVRMADDYFMRLPAQVRSKFSNDPAEFLDFVSNEENIGEIEAMGLIGVDVPGMPAVPASEASGDGSAGAEGAGGSGAAPPVGGSST